MTSPSPILGSLDSRSDGLQGVFETCKWLTVLSAMAIVGLIRR